MMMIYRKHWILFILLSLQCNATCGEGVRSREVVCSGALGGPVQNSLCAASSQPTPLQACSADPCQYIWRMGEWAQVRQGEEDQRVAHFNGG